MRLALIMTLVLAGPLPAAAQDGPALYAARCTSCHDSGSPRVPSRTTIAQLTPERVVAALESGTMQAQGASLTAEDRRALAVFITGRPMGSLAPVSTPRCPDVGSPLTPRPADPAWNGWGAGPANNRFQSAPAAKLATADVRSLQVKWAFGFAGDLMAAAQPVVIGGRIFVGSSSGRVFALNLRTGCAYWTFDADTTAGKSVCRAGCDTKWPALTVTGTPSYGDKLSASMFSTFKRDDGSTQLAVNGHPLYHFANDGKAGDTKGNGIGNVWYVVGADGKKIDNS